MGVLQCSSSFVLLLSEPLFKGCRRCRRPRKGAAAAQGQIEGSSREYCNTLDFCQVGSKARGSSPFHNLFEAGWCLGHQMIKEVLLGTLRGIW